MEQRALIGGIVTQHREYSVVRFVRSMNKLCWKVCEPEDLSSLLVLLVVLL